jgi:outer membrane translocation and assembly module TamA
MVRSTLDVILPALVTLIALTCCPFPAHASGCKDSASGLERTKIKIVSVEFRPESILPDHLRVQVSEALLESKLTKSPEAPDDEWVGELVGVTARDVVSNQGYFQSLIEIIPYLVKVERCAQFYAASVSIESGPQYRMGEIGFSATVFSEAQLKDQMQIAAGDLFDVSKIRASLDAIHWMHSRQGYIESTIEPVRAVDETKAMIDVTIKVEEGKQYRVNRVEILGLERYAQTLLKSRINIQKGDILDYPSLVEVLRTNLPLPPSAISVNKLISVYRDTQTGTVDVVIDLSVMSESPPSI